MTAGSPFGASSPRFSPFACACCFFSALTSILAESFGAPPFCGAPPFAGLAAAFFLSSAIDQISRTLGESNLATVVESLETDAGRLAVLGIGEGNVGQVDRQFLADDAALVLHRL